MSYKVIGLAGPARVGKDTVANHLERSENYKRYAFAGPLKAMLAAGFCLTEAHLEGDLKEKVLEPLGKSPRELMQTLGTEWARDTVHQDCWLIIAEKYCESHGKTIITDVRFPNEAAWVRARGELWHVRRRGAPSVSAHTSEVGIVPLEGEHVIHNDSTVEMLEFTVDKLLGVR
jgi:hypothetical protein